MWTLTPIATSAVTARPCAKSVKCVLPEYVKSLVRPDPSSVQAPVSIQKSIACTVVLVTRSVPQEMRVFRVNVSCHVRRGWPTAAVDVSTNKPTGATVVNVEPNVEQVRFAPVVPAS